MCTTKKFQICLFSIFTFFLFFSQNVNAQLTQQVKANSTLATCVDPTLINLNAQLPTIYAPVCGCDGVTYDNEYIAQTYNGLIAWTDGPCSCDLEIIGNVENVSCFGKSDGSISIDVIGGTPPFIVFWESNGTTNPNPNLNHLNAGEYVVTILDAMQCSATTTFTITQPDELQAEFEFTSDVCDEQVSGCLTVSGGTMPYNLHVFKLNQFDGVIPAVDVSQNNIPSVANASLTDEIVFENDTPSSLTRCANDIPAGHYLVVIVDEKGCYIIRHIFIPQANPLMTNFEIMNEDCSGTDGCFFIEGGSKPYRLFAFTCPDGTVPNLDAPQINAAGDVTVSNMQATDAVDVIENEFWGNEICAEEIPSGIYYVLVLDANNCWSYEVIEIAPSFGLEITGEVKNTSCGNPNGGAIDISVTGGNEPYFFEWSNGATTEDLAHVAPGIYTVEVYTSNDFCTAIATFEVLGFDALELNFSFDQYGDFACVDPEGGTAPYTITWVNLQSGNTLISTADFCKENIPEGVYLVEVIDAGGCAASEIFIIEEKPCMAGEVYLEPSEIISGESTTFVLENWNGLSLQWQFRTADTDWLIIPGANDEMYQTPNINVGTDKEILVRALVVCSDGEVLKTETAILFVKANPNLAPLSPKSVDSNLMNNDFMKMRKKDAENGLIRGNEIRRINANLFPTTTTSDLNISFDFESDKKTILRIVDLSGNQMWRKEMSNVTESTIENLQVSHLAHGRYFLHIENQGVVVTRSFFIEK